MPTFATVGGNKVLFYIPFTVTNSQGSPTGANFQQSIAFNQSTASTYLAADLKNVNVQDGAGNIFNSWRYSGTSNAGTDSKYLAKISGGIGASSSITVYYCIYGTAVNAIDGTTTGIAPWLTGTYGTSDNGAQVFTSFGGANTGYVNFAGNSAPTNWTINAAWVQNNGITITNNMGAAYNGTAFAGSTTLVLDFWGILGSTINAGQVGFGTVDTASAGVICAGTGKGSGGSATNVLSISGGFGGGYNYLDMGVGADNNVHVFSTVATDTTAAGKPFVSLIDFATATSNTTKGSDENVGVTGGNSSNVTAGPVYAFGVRVRPPGDVMPSATAGSINPVLPFSEVYNGENGVYGSLPSSVYT